MTDEEHEHNWSGWSGWNYAGYSTDMRTRTCGDHADAEYRQHHCAWAARPDVFAPIGSGLTIKVCTSCGTVKGT